MCFCSENDAMWGRDVHDTEIAFHLFVSSLLINWDITFKPTVQNSWEKDFCSFVVIDLFPC